MTPDQFISTMHRQRADQTALRLALVDLAQCLLPEQRAQWLQALQSRMATARSTAKDYPADQREGLLAMATAMDYLHRSLAQPATPAAPKEQNDDL